MVSFHNAIRVLQDPIKKLKIITNAFCSTSVFCTYKKDSFNQKTNSTCRRNTDRGWDPKFICTANALYQKFETNIPGNECGIIPNFYIHLPVSDLYIPQDRSANAIQQNRQTDRGKIYRLQIHECRNWERGRAVSFLGILFSVQCAAEIKISK